VSAHAQLGGVRGVGHSARAAAGRNLKRETAKRFEIEVLQVSRAVVLCRRQRQQSHVDVVA
jgi:hypothetical protein